MALETDLRSIAGLLPVSMVDWEGKLASVIFLSGCNLRCPYCHNPELVNSAGAGHISWEHIESELAEKHDWVDGVVITGGEPTISPDLRSIILRLRSSGFAIKLDTNGTRPKVLKELLEDGVLDCVAMDVKASFSNYDLVTRVVDQAEAVKTSIDAIIASGVDHEFRTTVVPGLLDPIDVVEIAEYLSERGAKRLYLQQFGPDNKLLEPGLESVKPFPLPIMEQTTKACSKFMPTKLRGNS